MRRWPRAFVLVRRAIFFAVETNEDGRTFVGGDLPAKTRRAAPHLRRLSLLSSSRLAEEAESCALKMSLLCDRQSGEPTSGRRS